MKANLAVFDYREIPEGDFVMNHVAWKTRSAVRKPSGFCEFCATHPSLELGKTYIVHISPQAKPSELLKAFRGRARKDRARNDCPVFGDFPAHLPRRW